MKRLGTYLRPYAWYIACTLTIKLIATVFELFIPFLMRTILDDIVPRGDRAAIFLYGGIMLACALCAMGTNIVANRMTAISSGRITRRVRYDLFEKLQHLTAGQMDALTVSSAEARLTSDTYNINQFLTRMQRMGVRAPIMLIGGITMMLGMDAVLALILIALLPPISVIVYLVTRRSVPLYTEQQTVLDRVVRVLQENITGVRVVKALSKTEHEKKRFHAENEELTRLDRKAGMITGITNPATSLVLNLGLTLVVVIGAFRVGSGVCKSGVIIAFLQYFVMISNAMLGITRVFVLWSKGVASANRVSDVLDMPEGMQVLSTSEQSDAEGEVPHVEFRDVTFSYTGIGENLSHLSFRLMHGESLGVLGETGAGKSTILNLLLRMYDPQEGCILLDGRDVRTIPPQELRGEIGAVFQNDFVMEGTIEDNIRFFRPIEEERLRVAVRDAQAEEFIADREGGMEADVAVRGNNLSGGQKQRLLIARALASEPKLLLLDDASSALDYRTDAALRRALRRGYCNTTSILIAQRVSSLRNCTRILVLSDGKAIGYGTHEELMRSCEEYRIIAHSQMGEGKEEV